MTSQESPKGVELSVALARWQHAAGAYWPYVCAVPFLGDTVPGSAARAGQTRLGRWLVKTTTAIPVERHPAIFVDLPPVQILPATPELIGLGFVVVPVIQRWIARPAVIDGAALVRQLAYFATRVRRVPDERGVVFLLDGDRAGPDAKAAASRAFDNRYDYSRDRFPPASFLRARGIDSLYWTSLSEPAEDLRPYWDEQKEEFGGEADEIVYRPLRLDPPSPLVL